jgi:hypothetical protein
MITLIPIEPLNEQHGALIVTAFSRLFIDGGGQPGGWGYGDWGYGDGDGDGWGYGRGWGTGYGYGNGDGRGNGGTIPDEWRVE